MNTDIGHLLKLINDKMKVNADENLKRYGLTLSQMRVLGFLHHRGGQATQRELESLLGVAHPTVVGLVSRLKKGGFLDFYPDPADRRNKIVFMTEKAKEIDVMVIENRKAMEIALLKGLSEKEKAELYRLLSILKDNLYQ